ncbi:MAG: HlyD family efflux transporter periplasmic adaptor subunit [Pedosphaera sp.]|nr:HlyD family efflux transporter periplasmic adaptor subunit [Pedosphaera sp.]
MQKFNKLITFVRRQPRWRLALAAVLVAGAGYWFFHRGANPSARIATFAARRGPLDITVLEGGSLQALESQESKCEVRVGYQGTKILKIVEEGYLVTEDDVKTNKVLVELDSSELEKQIVQQEIQYQSALASLTDAQQGYEIQLNQNLSDVKGAEQKVRFARMDFDKFLGDTVTTQLVKQLGLDKLIAEATTNDVSTAAIEDPAEPAPPKPSAAFPAPAGAEGRSRTRPANAPPAGNPVVIAQPVNSEALATASRPANREARSAPSAVVNAPGGKPGGGAPQPAPEPRRASFQLPSTATIDFDQFAHIEALGDGEAKQKLRKMEDDVQVAQKELGQSKVTLEGTRRLFEKGFVTKNDLQRDEIAYDNNRLKVQTAETARDLFLKYDFPKSAEESLSKYLDSVRELDKTRRQAISKLAQADARLKSGQGQYEVQVRQRKDLAEQRDKCLIRAKKSGLVVYGAGGDNMFYYGGEERIREGASVRERQAIITIPDMTRMSVNVKIHETYIKKIQKGQKARITVDAFADKVLTGEVTKVGVLPDSQNRWMNPDLKVYAVTIAIDGSHDWVKPGMSTKVEVMVTRLDDVVQIPVQAVSFNDGKQVCYIAGGFKPERREVEVGEFTDEFIEVKRGLKEGERVLLRTPDGVEMDSGKSKPAKPAPAKPEKTADKPKPADKPVKA